MTDVCRSFLSNLLRVTVTIPRDLGNHRCKRLDDVAGAAIEEATQLDLGEAPQRELDRKKADELAKAAEREQAGLENEPHFRP
jgi:hypothetical protein